VSSAYRERKLGDAWNEATGHRDFEEHGAHASWTLSAAPWWTWGRVAERRLAADRDPAATSSIHPGIKLWSAPAAMQKLAAAFDLGSSSLPSLAPSKIPATSASRSGRSPAISRSSGTAAFVSSCVGSRQGAWRLATLIKRVVSI
jgi:hypothetical protein